MGPQLAISRRNLLVTTVLAAAGPALASAGPSSPRSEIYRDPRASVPLRVADLIARMTLEEKAAQLSCHWVGKAAYYDEQGNFSATKAAGVLKDGIGQIARPGDYRGLERWTDHPFRSIENTAKFVNDLQHFLVTQTRLGIPALFHDELAHGLLAADATIFPVPPALGSSFDPELVEQVFTVAARQARARGTTVALTPVLDLLRDPRYGRAEEFFGEDPYLVGEMGVAAVRGLQGRARPLAPDRVFATLKHFIHGVPQGGLNISPFDVSERGLRETFLVPFGAVIARADPANIMPSYNEVAGVPSHANRHLLQDIGRSLLGFRGLYMSDYGAIGNLVTQHHVAANDADAAVTAMFAGVGADLPEGDSYRSIPALVQGGRVPEALVDRAVSKILALKFEAGLFDHPYVAESGLRHATGSPSDVALARKAAEKALILLKNDGAVPLRPRSGLKIAVIGPNSLEPLFGGYSGSTRQGVGIFEGIRRLAPAGVTVEQADGVWITPPDKLGLHRSYSITDPVPVADNRKRIAEALELASRSDVVVLAVGDVPAITREAVALSLPGDRDTLSLWGQQDDLIDALAATGKPIVALILSGRPLAVGNLAAKANALFQGWYLGEQGGLAFADMLFGRTNPGGKLPVSMPRSVGDLPDFYNHHPSADTNRYIEAPRTPLFPFGHGLSYTRFDISAPRLVKAVVAPVEGADLDVDVANIRDMTGDEVVQVYVTDDVSSVPRPVLELKAFERVTLAPGERRTLRFRLGWEALAMWDQDMNHVVELGTFTIHAGSSSVSLKSCTLTVVGSPSGGETPRSSG